MQPSAPTPTVETTGRRLHGKPSFGIGLILAITVLAGCGTSPATPNSPTASDAPAIQGNQTADAESDYPITVTNCGYEVTFAQPPTRIVAIKSTSIEMLLAFGLADRIIGVGYPDGPYSPLWAPAQEIPVISDKVPSQEAVVGLEPDLVYAGWESNLTADGAGDRDLLASLNIGTFVSPAACQEPEYQPNPLTWDNIWSEITLAGSILGVPDKAATLIADQKARLANVTPDSRGLSALWYSSGSDTPFVGAGIGNPQLVMDAVGLSNIASDLPATWSSYSWEAVVAADPDVIVLVDSSWGSTEKKIAQLESNPATAQLTAVQRMQYIVVPFPAGEAGVRSVEAVETMSEQLADLDIAVQ